MRKKAPAPEGGRLPAMRKPDGRRLKSAGRTAGRYLLDYLELVLAAVLAIVVSFLALKDEISTKGLIQATVLLLVALAISVIRERAERRALGAHIENTLLLVAADKPWQVLDEQLVWDLSAPDGSYAKAFAKRELQFMQDEVLSVYEYQNRPPGKVLSHVCHGGQRGGPMINLPIIQKDFPGPAGRVYRLISLQRVWGKGEIMAFESERELENHFLGSSELVAKEIPVPTARVSMRVIWPLDRKPKALWVERSGRAPVNISLGRLKDSEGRWSYEEVVEDPKLGEKIIVRWDW